MLNDYRNRILFYELVQYEDELNDIASKYDDKGDVLTACKLLLSDNIPSMDIEMTFISQKSSNSVLCEIEMQTNSMTEVSSDYLEEYKLKDVSIKKFVEFFMNSDKNTFQEFAINICNRFCNDLINEKYNRTITVNIDGHDKNAIDRMM